jgi:hypothetical protein
MREACREIVLGLGEGAGTLWQRGILNVEYLIQVFSYAVSSVAISWPWPRPNLGKCLPSGDRLGEVFVLEGRGHAVDLAFRQPDA